MICFEAITRTSLIPDDCRLVTRTVETRVQNSKTSFDKSDDGETLKNSFSSKSAYRNDLRGITKLLRVGKEVSFGTSHGDLNQFIRSKLSRLFLTSVRNISIADTRSRSFLSKFIKFYSIASHETPFSI